MEKYYCKLPCIAPGGYMIFCSRFAGDIRERAIPGVSKLPAIYKCLFLHHLESNQVALGLYLKPINGRLLACVKNLFQIHWDFLFCYINNIGFATRKNQGNIEISKLLRKCIEQVSNHTRSTLLKNFCSSTLPVSRFLWRFCN